MELPYSSDYLKSWDYWQKSVYDRARTQMMINSAMHQHKLQEEIEKAKLLINEKENMDSQFKLNVEYTNKSSAYGHSRIIKVTKSGSTVFRVDAIPFPECCGICIFKNMSLSDMTRSEFSEMMNMIIKHLQEEDLFSMILLYSHDSAAIIKQLSKFDGAVMTGIFKNRRSGNMLAGFEINIDPKKNRVRLSDEDEDEDYEEVNDEDGEEDEESSEGVGLFAEELEIQPPLSASSLENAARNFFSNPFTANPYARTTYSDIK